MTEYVPCNYGNCNVGIDPVTGRIDFSFGPVGCMCDSTYGWKSKYLDGQSKPRVKAKAIGPQGSRVVRSKRRHDKAQRFSDYVDSLFSDVVFFDNNSDNSNDSKVPKVQALFPNRSVFGVTREKEEDSK